MRLFPNIFGANDFGPAFYRLFLPWAIRHPRYIRSASFLLRSYAKAFQFRDKAEKNGLKIPPTLILSLTKQCNLSCTGCFAEASGITCNKNNENNTKNQLDWVEWKKIISDARDLGVFGFFLAGGEPFLYPKLLDLCKKFNDRCFIIFTNGTAIKNSDFEKLRLLSNTAIIVSVEGGELATNQRRGDGVYQKAMVSLKSLSSIGTPNGISVTVTRKNYRYWMNNKSIDRLITQGVRAAVFIEYIPVNLNSQLSFTQSFDNNTVQKNENFLMLTKEERLAFRKHILNYRQTKPILIIHSPGDEELFGGCVSAGRGFAHVTPSGDLTACPVSNIATHNLTNATLRDGFSSPLFTKIRENEHLLENEGTPCSLFAHPKEVAELAREVKAYRTDN